MNQRISRRTFVTASGGAALLGPPMAALAQSPQVLIRRSAKPVVVASPTGYKAQNADGSTCVDKAFELLTGGADMLDAAIAGVNIVELDPDETCVGYGGLPNADGVVQLDASVMHGPLKRAGAVAYLEGVRTPSLVAKKVMEETDHYLLVGRDAQQFARNQGFKIEDDLFSEKSRALWQEWKRRGERSPFLKPKERAEAWRQAGESMLADGLIDAEHFHGTVNCLALNAKGAVAGVTSTSGLAWKVPGRAAGSTGNGEAAMFSLGSFLIVEAMRNGSSPKDAGIAALKRVVANTVDKRAQLAVCTQDGSQMVPAEPLLTGKPSD